MTSPTRWYGPNSRERLGIAQVLAETAPAQTATPPTVRMVNYTLTAADAGHTIEMNSATAVTVTVPSAVFTAGQTVTLVQIGAGLLTVAGGAGMTVNTPTTLKSNGQWSSMTVRFRSGSTAVLSGNISAT